MIHTVTHSAKFKKLVRRLRPYVQSCPVSPEAIAVGILESLWHVTISSARRGNIGKIDDETIAEMVGWYEDPEILISCLVDTGWLDRDEEYRLIVHDWSEHAPAFIKKNIRRIGGFCDGKQPQDCSGEPGSDCKVAHDAGLAATPNPTQPNPTKHNPTQPNPSGGGLAAVGDVDCGEVLRIARRLRKARPMFDASYCWRVCWGCERLEIGSAASIVSSIESGNVRDARAYIDGAIRKRCNDIGVITSELYDDMPTPQKPSIPSDVAKDLAKANSV